MGGFFTFLGRLHPVIVHLPIGILLIALLLEALSARGERGAALKPAADLTLGLGVLAAVFSCCTGYLLSLKGDYDAALVTTHLWLAVSLTLVSGALYILLKGKPMVPLTRGLAIAVLLLVFLTGHWGGSLTHGPGYLTTDLVSGPPVPALRPVADVQGAVVYIGLVQPVLHDNCYGCHSGGHVKGGLRLDAPETIRKGGKDGPVIMAGNAASSLLIKRVLLPEDDEHHMAPKDKPQLTKAEVKLLQWWIQTGASFDSPASRLPQDGDIRAVLAAFHDGTAGPVNEGAVVLNVADSDMPVTPVAPASAEAVRRLEGAGALVLPIARGSNYLSVRFSARGGESGGVGADAWAALALVRQQLVELRCSGVHAGDEIITIAAGCPQLVRLRLDHTAITGKNLGLLGGLNHLRYLDLASTKVHAEDVLQLRGLTGLKSLYLYETAVLPGDWAGLRAGFPHTTIDSGGYRLPFLPADTAIVRRP